MNRIKLKKGLHLLIHGQEYSVKERLPNGEVYLNNLLTNTNSKLKETTLTQLLFKGELQFINSDRFEVREQSKNVFNHRDFTQLPEALRKEAKRRYSYVDRVVKSTPDKQTAKTLKPVITEVSQEISDDKPPSWSTLYRWHKSYFSAGQDIRALVPLHSAKGNYQSRLNPEVRQIIKDAIDEVYLNLTQAQGTLILDTNLPIVLIGLPEAEQILKLKDHSQLSRRFANRCRLSPFSWHSDSGEEFRTFLHLLESQLLLESDSNLSGLNLARRFYYASDGVVAYIMKLIRYGTYLALQQSKEQLDLSILAVTFEKYVHADKPNKVNPFLSDEFEICQPKSLSSESVEATNNRLKSAAKKRRNPKKASSVLTTR